MRRATICCFATALAISIVVRAASNPDANLEPRITILEPRTANREPRNVAYLGSESCRDCHADQYSTWKKSLHVEMTRPIADARVLGDFSGARLEQNGRKYTMNVREGRYVISVAHGERPSETFEVHYTLGARRFQGYLSRLADGRIYALPVFWRTGTQQWIDYAVIGPVPDGPHEYRQIWNVNCVNCHATNLAPNYSVEAARYETTWTEMGIGCEACHGPGGNHVPLMRKRAREGGKTAAGRVPVAEVASLGIFSSRAATKRESFDACAYCHGNKKNLFLGFTAGDRYEDFALPFLVSEPRPANDPQGDYWPDGRPNRFNRPQALMQSGCFRTGAVTCTDCHRMHGAAGDHALKVTATRTDALCTQCHQAFGTEHTHHAPTSAGSRCIECHMSDVNWRLLNRRRDHTFAPPVPEMTAAYGAPNPCTTCHDNRTPEWAAAVMDRWYGDSARRKAVVAIADVMYAAGRGDTAAIPRLVSLAANASASPVLRASAAGFIARLAPTLLASPPAADGRRTVPPMGAHLARATADREAIVRAAAVEAAGAVGDAAVVPMLVPRLSDAARVVRIMAAGALLRLGVTSMDGPAGEVLERAQQELAQSLRTFPDSAAAHTSLAQLAAAKQNPNEAERALATAVRLAPDDPRPLVVRGVLLAQQGKLEDAVRSWEAALRLAPQDATVKRLIAEAQRRIQEIRRSREK